MRCFVALWPDEDARGRLDELTRTWHRRFAAARRMRRDNLHLTLAFIGELESDRARQIAQRLAQRSWQPGVWRVDRIGAFERARVLWAGSADDPQLGAIAAAVRAVLDELQVRYDRKPFAPHVTLLRNLPRAAFETAQAIDPPIEWVRQPPVLLHSTHEADGTRYVALAPDAISAPTARDTDR
jgi:2'-5' RNA ligase